MKRKEDKYIEKRLDYNRVIEDIDYYIKQDNMTKAISLKDKYQITYSMFCRKSKNKEKLFLLFPDAVSREILKRKDTKNEIFFIAHPIFTLFPSSLMSLVVMTMTKNTFPIFYVFPVFYVFFYIVFFCQLKKGYKKDERLAEQLKIENKT